MGPINCIWWPDWDILVPAGFYKTAIAASSIQQTSSCCHHQSQSACTSAQSKNPVMPHERPSAERSGKICPMSPKVCSARTYLDGMHVYSLALLASQPQHNLLCCLSLQAATPCCSEQQQQTPCSSIYKINNDWLELKDITDADRKEQQGGAAAHLLVKDWLSLTTISCLLSVVPPLTCSFREPIASRRGETQEVYQADYNLAINPRLGLASTQPYLERTS